MTKNKNSTRYYSDLQEKYIANKFGGYQRSNSGAGTFNKGDVVLEDASMLVECKTCSTDKDSMSIKKEWIEKNKQESFLNRLENSCIAFNFGPNSSNYFIIDEKLMHFLVD